MGRRPEIYPQEEQLIGQPVYNLICELVRQQPQIGFVSLKRYIYSDPHTVKGGPSEIIRLARNAFLTREEVNKMASALKGGWNLGFNSRVQLQDGTTAHLPMVDLAVTGEKGRLKAKERIREIVGRGGFLVESGNSYHFYGKGLLLEDAWVNFLGLMLLASRVHSDGTIEHIVDSRAIGHYLVNGFATLDVFRSSMPEPRVVDIF